MIAVIDLRNAARARGCSKLGGMSKVGINCQGVVMRSKEITWELGFCKPKDWHYQHVGNWRRRRRRICIQATIQPEADSHKKQQRMTA